MARRSRIEMVKASLVVPRGHDAFWAMIREANMAGPWDLSSLDAQSNVDATTIRDFVRRLVRAGLAVQVGSRPQTGTGKGRADLFRLMQTPFLTPRLDRDGKALPESKRETLWRAMKMLKTFDAAELSREASLPERPISLQHAYKYLVVLAAVGILAPIDKSRSARSARYRLVRNLGALAPSVGRAEVVFDPNSRTVIGEPVLEVAP